MMEDIVRVLRIIEYVGPRSWVEDTVARSITHRRVDATKHIKGATIGTYPEILTKETHADSTNQP